MTAHRLSTAAVNPNSRNTKPAPFVSPNALFGCAVAGLLIGQVVAGIATHQPNAALRLAMALVFLVSGAASVLSLAKHLHLQGQAAAQTAPLHTWTLALGAGLLASLHVTSLLAG